MPYTAGTILEVTAQAQELDGPWYNVRAHPLANQLVAQITTNGNGTIILQGRIGPGHDPIQLASTTSGFSGLVGMYGQIRAIVRSPTGPGPTAKVAIGGTSYTDGVATLFNPSVTLTAAADDETPVASQLVTLTATRSDLASGKSVTCTLIYRDRAGGTLVGIAP